MVGQDDWGNGKSMGIEVVGMVRRRDLQSLSCLSMRGGASRPL